MCSGLDYLTLICHLLIDIRNNHTRILYLPPYFYLKSHHHRGLNAWGNPPCHTRNIYQFFHYSELFHHIPFLSISSISRMKEHHSVVSDLSII